MDAGWTLSEENKAKVTPSMSYNIFTLDKGTKKVRISTTNVSDAEMLASECPITSAKFSKSDLEDSEITFQGGLKYGATMDEVIALYGEPTSWEDKSTTPINEKTSYFSYFYDYEKSRTADITIMFDTDGLVKYVSYEINPRYFIK